VRHSLICSASKPACQQYAQQYARHRWRAIKATSPRVPKMTRGTMFHEFSARIRDLFSGR
jgi:hypothetical protein